MTREDLLRAAEAAAQPFHGDYYDGLIQQEVIDAIVAVAEKWAHETDVKVTAVFDPLVAELRADNARLTAEVGILGAQLDASRRNATDAEVAATQLRAEVERLKVRGENYDHSLCRREIAAILAEHDADLVTLNRVRDVCREVAAGLQTRCSRMERDDFDHIDDELSRLATTLLDAANGTEAKTEWHAINCERRTKGICLCTAPAHIQPQPVADPSPAPSEAKQLYINGPDGPIPVIVDPKQKESFIFHGTAAIEPGPFTGKFKCPKCGYGRWGTSNCTSPFKEWIGYCNSVGCGFTWDRFNADHVVGLNEYPWTDCDKCEGEGHIEDKPHTPAETAKAPENCDNCMKQGKPDWAVSCAKIVHDLIQERDAALAECERWQRDYDEQSKLLLGKIRALESVTVMTTATDEPTTHYTAMQEVKRLRDVIVRLERIRLRTGQLLDAIEHTEQPDAIGVLQREHQDLCRKRRDLLKEVGL